MADNRDFAQTYGRSRSDLAAGLIFVAIAAVFGWQATHYEMGQSIRMGPGFVPLVLAVLLGAFGVAVALFGRPVEDEAEPEPVSWRGIVLICAALIIFGAYCRSLGLVPVIFICALISSLASSRNSPLSAVAIAAVLTVLCWVIFKLGLGMTLPAVGPAFGSLQVF